MICANCGTENAVGAKFCNECAARLALACPSCGATNPPTAKFCSECASSLSAPVQTGATATDPADPAPRSGGSERRLVTVLFADLVGFTPLAAAQDPEETRELLGRYFDLARDIVRRYGGT